jgi:hypothetical protein
MTAEQLIAQAPHTPPLQDDRPINEYYFLRTPCSDCFPGVEFLRTHLQTALTTIRPETIK